MITCQQCGVELESNMNFCPLCGHPVEKGPIPVREPVNIKYDKDFQGSYSGLNHLNKAQRRKLFWEVTSIILLPGILGVMLLNLVFNQGLTWSVYPIILGLSIFAYISVITLWHGRRRRQVVAAFLITSLMLLFVDLAYQGVQWWTKVAMPLLTGACMIGAGLFAIGKKVRYYGFNLMAYIFIGLALLMMLIEGVVSYYQLQTIHLEWSIIVLISVIPVSLVLLYVHFRLRKNPDLKKFFHI